MVNNLKAVPASLRCRDCFNFFATDNAGNSETPNQVTVLIDETPPQSTAELLTDNGTQLMRPSHVLPAEISIFLACLTGSATRFVISMGGGSCILRKMMSIDRTINSAVRRTRQF
jgi:hypothetical protein